MNYTLERIHVSSGSHTMPTATVELMNSINQVIADTAVGNSTVDAIHKAIGRIVQFIGEVASFSVASTQKGVIMAEVNISANGSVYTGCSESADIISAIAEAYLIALNLLLTVQEDA